jgi:hypothetical protein
MFSPDNGETFRAKLTVPERSNYAPALAFASSSTNDSSGLTSPATGLLAWTGINTHLNVATVWLRASAENSAGAAITSLKAPPLDEKSASGPALACWKSRPFLAWNGNGDKYLNLVPIILRTRTGNDFPTVEIGPKTTFDQRTPYSPALAEHRDHLWLAWTGSDRHLNVARITTRLSSGVATASELSEAFTSSETSDAGPALCSIRDRLFLAWKGAGNDDLNLMYSNDGGTTFRGKVLLGEASPFTPSLAVNPARAQDYQLLMAWTGTDGRLNIR